ncbi:DUF6058 family natural product biosynthesis protein [Actinoallomurus rhizosphaericola]|uniref:DUF6058 family natural product biosynthesis protein n=1 Tax=Actinoallomurus rhizosphaericola TaxID=2952536 RepID=UPI0020922D36|nr:DUF6058 family natural product biosynthesis protein [Actinoallomurus rhizosphaericola]MCO6000249.1 DUF6058 family natural product biosynthesis protein [Actinoallomurus rhizosphaericola]
MSQQFGPAVRGLDGDGTSQIAIDAEAAAAAKRAIRARCQVLRPAMMGARDIRYVKARYLPLRDVANAAGRDLAEVKALIDAGLLPQPSYVLPDGTGMFPPDYLALWDAAGDVTELPELFRVRYQSAAAARHVALGDDEIDQAWRDYLTGEYGVCLISVTPETILDKGIQTERIEALLAEPHPNDLEWRDRLHAAVDALDALERPFTGFDRRRFGHPTSRDRLITAVRRAYPKGSDRDYGVEEGGEGLLR